MRERRDEYFKVCPSYFDVEIYLFFSGRKHNTDDIIATVLAVEPMRFIYRGRIAVFSIKVRTQ